jgi:hypothetical protein
VDNELERMQKNVVMAQFKKLFQHLPRRTEKSHEEPFMIAGHLGVVQTLDLPNIQQDSKSLICDARQQMLLCSIVHNIITKQN